jgi:predicted  nucleic acid-binding Zn-ribbon protein
MLPDLERLIHLQDLESRAAAAARVVASAPERIAALETRLVAARAAVETAKTTLTDNQAARRSVDKDLAAAQQRLEKYKEQSMAVKTNAEFHAMQHQMEAVKAEIDQFESRALEVMMAADECAAAQKQAEARLKAEETAVANERRAIESSRSAAEADIQACASDRAAVVQALDPHLVATFERVARTRGGVGVARAEKERCVVCQVRLRPAVFQLVMRNAEIIQCDSCQRVLYYAPPPATASTSAPPGPGAPPAP